jgi:hypothetical protein
MSLTAGMVRELKSLEKKSGLLLTSDVVALARDPTSELHRHPAFEWDIERAAYKSWMDAARSIVQVYVEIIDDPESDRRETMRGFMHVRMDTPSGMTHAYRSTKTVLLEDRATILNAVCDRIVSAIKSYPLPEFDPVLELVEQIRGAADAAARKKRKPGRKKGGGREVHV